MGNLIRMDLYRMNKAKSFRVCLILAFVLALCATPLEWAILQLGKVLDSSKYVAMSPTTDLAKLIASPMASINIMLALLSVVCFFHADMENGYIKNIAGQMPKRGYSILSRYIAAIVHSLVFMLVSLAGYIAGSLPFQQVVVQSSIGEAVLYFILKWLLLQAICAILLLVTASFRNKSLGMILAVLLGLPLMGLIYLGINTGLGQVIKGADINPYMPDMVLRETAPDKLRALLVAAVTIGVFLPLSIRVFDAKDIK